MLGRLTSIADGEAALQAGVCDMVGAARAHREAQGEEAARYARNRKEQQEKEAETRWDMAEKILAGELTLEELPDDMGAHTSFTIEDYVTQVGQGPIKGRGEELLAPSDTRLILLRRIWLREVNALVEGRPLTDWKLPTEPFIPASVWEEQLADTSA